MKKAITLTEGILNNILIFDKDEVVEVTKIYGKHATIKTKNGFVVPIRKDKLKIIK